MRSVAAAGGVESFVAAQRGGIAKSEDDKGRTFFDVEGRTMPLPKLIAIPIHILFSINSWMKRSVSGKVSVFCSGNEPLMHMEYLHAG